MCEGSRSADKDSPVTADVAKKNQDASGGFALMPAVWQVKKMRIPNKEAAKQPFNEPMMATYKVNRMFSSAANMAAAAFVALLCLVYAINPVEDWQYLPDGERTVATVAFAIAAMSIIPVCVTFGLGRKEDKMSGIVYAGLVVMSISMTTNGILAFAPTVVKEDPIIYSRVFLVRWCEWIPCAGLMTFLCDAVDVPRSKNALRTAILYSLCQTFSCVFGLIFPYCPGIISWSIAIFLACATWAPVFPRTYYKYKIYAATPKGNCFADMERYNRHKYSYELMLLCAMLWSFLVFAYFVNAYAHVMYLPGHFLRPYSLAMYVDTAFDVMAKSLYMRQIMDTHKAVFESEGLAQRQLAELRQLMSVLWSSSSDMIVLSIKHELKCLTLFSPAFSELLTGRPPMENDSGEQQALVMEVEWNVDDEKNGLKNEFRKIHRVYYVDSSDCNFEFVHQAAVESQVEPESFQAEIALQMLNEGWAFVPSARKGYSSPLVPFDFERRDGSKCICEMKILPHSENGMIAVVRDVSDRFRRFEAERKAEAEALKRQKESQSQTRFVRHEVKNGLLAGIELIDNLRNALGTVPKDDDEPEVSKAPNSLCSAPDEFANISHAWKRLGELDSNLHEVLNTVLAEAMARDVIQEVYEPRFENIDVAALLRNSCSNVERFPVRMTQADMPLLRLDPQLLRYIHRNAVSNACKYGKQGDMVPTLITYHKDTSEFELQVLNTPGPGHDKLMGLGEAASDAVFEQGRQLHKDLSIKDRFISSGDGAWIAQKCARAMQGRCGIKFEKDLTVFSFRCTAESLVPTDKLTMVNFEVPPETVGVAIDDSKIQRKLLSRILGLVGVAEDRQTVIGEKPSDVFEMESIILGVLKSRPQAKVLVIVDENLDYGNRGGEVVILSGSRVMKDILTALRPEDEKRVFALVRSANDSTTDLATYLSRTHGFFPKAPMNRDLVREVLAPLWAERFEKDPR